jgi:hypothetical protein
MSLSERRRAGEAWARLALGEHASVPSFARFVMELVAVGAPPDLLERAATAIGDEVRHARLAFGYASKLLERAVGPSALDITGSLDRAPSIDDVAIATFADGCIEEAIAAEQARQASLRCTGDAVEIWNVIAADEARHAELAWRTVEWLVEQHPALAATLQAKLGEAAEYVCGSAELAMGEDENAGLESYGILSRRTLAEIGVNYFEQSLRPRALALFSKACVLT